MQIKKLKIGNLVLKNPILLAPMVDVTDCAYRKICRDQGASLAYTEMTYVDAIIHKNKKTQNAIKTYPKENPKAIQITGSNLEEFEKALPFLKKYDLIDLNCGCPSIRIIGSKGGAYLLQDPKKIAEIIKILKKTGKTVTVKIRLGFLKNNANEIAKSIEKAGADALTVHARLSNESYSKPANYKELEKIKKIIKIPLIGNGDIFSGKDAEKVLKICDGIMVARGAMGDPTIFSRILKYLKTGKESKKDIKQNILLYKEYLSLHKKYKLDSIQKTKFIGTHFIKDFQSASKYRDKIMKCSNFKDIESVIKEITEQL